MSDTPFAPIAARSRDRLRDVTTLYTLPIASTVAAASLAAASSGPSLLGPSLVIAALGVSIRFGGRRAGIAASLLGALLVIPASAGTMGVAERVLLAGALLSVTFLSGGATDALRAARHDAARMTGELGLRNEALQRVNASMEKEMEEVQVLTEHLSESNEALLTARDEAERLAARATRLRDVVLSLSEASTVAEVAAVALGDGLAAVQGVRGALWVCEDETHPVLADARGYAPAQLSKLRAFTLSDDTPVCTAMKSRGPVWIRSPEEYRRSYPRLYEAFGAVSDAQTFLAAPLLHHGVLVGALSLSFEGPGARGAADEVFTLLLADATGQALHRARSFDVERERRSAAETLARAREDVLGVVAHDLRNPLHLIGMTAQLIRELDAPSERAVRLLGVVERAVAQMNRLVGDLLDTVRLESGRLSLDLSPVAVEVLLRHTEESFLPLAAERQIRLEVARCGGGARVCADPERLHQALGNLVGNALKFVPPGGQVRVELTSRDAMVVFAVADTGPGIPADALEHLFDRFWQARRSDRRGVGLGLAIAKGIVEAHGGRIWVESRLGKGTTFFVSLPAHPGS
jgi:signal transduction histidine kinase